MNNLRRWQLSPTQAYALPLAADTQIANTDYEDDQIWNLLLGTDDSAAMALQTKYGGRAGLASLVPMWVHQGKIIYQSTQYATPPVITRFAPGYIQVQSQPIPDLAVTNEFWVMDSHAIGGVVSLQNNSAKAIDMQLDLFGHVGIEGKEGKLGIIDLPRSGHALYMGQIRNLNPIVMMEGGSIIEDEFAPSPKIGKRLKIKAGKSQTLRWIHVGLSTVYDSLRYADQWLKRKWKPFFDQINHLALAIPMIQTGNKNWDAVIASSYHQLMQSFLQATDHLPSPSFVGTRIFSQGYSKRDGSDYNRAWSGQEPTLAYLVASATAAIAPTLAEGIIVNYLSTQTEDGWIEQKPGLGGQRQDLMAMPILARTTWNIFLYTENLDFLKQSYSGLHKFFLRWLASPNWSHERQTGILALPTFATGQAWGQGLDINTVDSPELIGYLLSEAIALRDMAQVLGKKSDFAALDRSIERLQTTLNEMWNGKRFAYRDRETHRTTAGMTLLDKGAGDQEHWISTKMDTPSRLIVKILGGVSHIPDIHLKMSGLDTAGNPITEQARVKDFVWQRRQGVMTTGHVFSQVDRIQCEGLSRVYSITATTPDLTALDINAILPIWSRGITDKQANALMKLIADKQYFWRENGIGLLSQQESTLDIETEDSIDAIWVFWLTLIGEGMIENGFARKADDFVKQLLNVQTQVLEQQHNFFQFYHRQFPAGLGEMGHLAGIAPLHLLQRLIGVRIISNRKVWAGGDFGWGRAITVRQHGVTVKRNTKTIEIEFPSGHKVKLDGNAKWQAVVDPKPKKISKAKTPALPTPPSPRNKSTSERVLIDIEIDE